MAEYIHLEDVSSTFSHPSSIAETLHTYHLSSPDKEKSFQDDAAKPKGIRRSYARISSSTVASKISAAQDKSDVNWTLEIICVIISIICFCALAIVFKYYDGKPLSVWTFYFSMNTVASILGTVGKSTLLLAVSAAIGQGKWLWFQDRERNLIEFDTFDEASRGPLGSLKLLWRTRARYVRFPSGYQHFGFENSSHTN
jgi:hypothetical protein